MVGELKATDGQDGVLGLASWIVEGLEIPLGEAVPLLAAVREPQANRGGLDSGEGQEIAPLIGADLLFWSHAAKLLLDLIVRQRFVPYLESEGDGDERGGYRAAWKPLLIEKEDLERINLLVESMPPVCRAGHEADPYRLVESFLSEGVDMMVRKWAGRRHPEGPRASESLGAEWFSSLVSPDSTMLRGNLKNLSGLRGQVDSWLEEVHSKTPRLRCCFRLEEPGMAQAESGRKLRAEVYRDRTSDWTLSYFLQATDDPSFLLPAAQAWKGKGAAKFDPAEVEATMLRDLGKASRLCAKIDQSLKRSAAPTSSRLDTDEAYSFLANDAWLLKESGFGVLVPSWSSGGRGSRLQIRVKARPPQQQQAGRGSGIFTLRSVVEFDWKVAVGDGSIVLTEEEFTKLVSLKQPLVSVRGQWVELRQEDVKSALDMLRSYKGSGGIPASDVIELAAAGASVGSVEVRVTEAEGWLGGVMQRLLNLEVQEQLPTPKPFRGTLRPYQSRGLSWLAFMGGLGLGACLADDMGLGKTAQFIALVLHNYSSRDPGSNGQQKVLVVCPTSIVGNWRRELEKFAPSLRVMVHHGPDRSRGGDFARAAQAHDLVITSYPLITRDAAELSGVEWVIVALDEAQNIKNSWTKQSKAVRRLKASRRIALTGTPIENRLSELWSIMDFLNPGYLGSLREFRKAYAIPIERYGDAGTQQRLRRVVQPFVLRRLKTDPGVIDDLPDKLEAKVYCDLSDEQASLYEAYVKEMLAKIASSDGIERRGLVLAALTRLKQICDHPSLFLADRSGKLEGRSGKMERLREMLDEVVTSGEKALVFTQYAQMGEMLRGHLQSSLGCEALFLHGGVPRKTRDEMVSRFQNGEGPPIFVLSLRAGGLGLNLTAANHVFHYDRWWNPAVENQATDRAHRIGQKKAVQVNKLISGGTLEDKIDLMIEHKKGLAEDIIGAGEAWLTELSTEELRDVFMLRREGRAAGGR